MTQLTLGEAQSKLAEWLEQAAQGQAVEIQDNGVTYEVSVTLKQIPHLTKRTPGLGQGALRYMSEDFDEELPESFWLGE